MKNSGVDDQIGTMKALLQGAAQWLLGFSSSSVLRETADVPRNADGTYNAAALLEWARSRVKPATLTDDEIERIVRVAEHITIEYRVRPIIELLAYLDREHGDRGLAGFCRELLREMKEFHEGELRHDPNYDRKADPDVDRLNQLQYAVVCEYCNRLRRGRKWLKGVAPPADLRVMKGVCDRCHV